MRFILQFLFGLLLVLGMAACQTPSVPPKLEAVQSLPLPKLPDWIAQISPTGDAETLAQIRIRFKEALIPVEAIDSPDQQKLLEKFEIVPSLAGKFRFLTPRLVGFQADQAIPKATRVKVTLKSGLKDLKSHQLAADLAWTFNTESIKITNLPELDDQSTDIKPTLKFTANTELDLASLQESLVLTPQGKTNTIAIKVEQKKEDPALPTYEDAQENFDPALGDWIYTVTPQQALAKAERYRLEFKTGLRPVQGNLGSDRSFMGEFKTYSPLAFEKVEFTGKPNGSSAYGRFIKGAAQLVFNNGIEAQSAIAAISVTPAAKPSVPLVKSYDGDRTISLNPYALEPSTNYTIAIAPQLKDKFGQTLEQPITVNYQTGDIAAEIWAPTGLNIFPSGKNLQLNVSTVNLPEAKFTNAFKVLQPQDLVYLEERYLSEDSKLLPASSTWSSVAVSKDKNKSVETAIPLAEKLGKSTGVLAYGVEAKTYTYEEENPQKSQKWRSPSFYGIVQLTNLGMFSQWFPDSGLVRVHHLSDGAAVKGAKVEIYQSQLEAKSKPTPIPCAIAKTDQTGTVLFNATDLRSCMSGAASFKEAPKLLAIAYENQDWAFARSTEYSGGYGYGIYTGWQGSKPESRGTIFSDRQLYQPGEKAWFTGTAYYLQDGVLKQDQNVNYTVTLNHPDGSKTDLGKQPTNQFGTFSMALPIASNQALGFYSITAKGENGVEITGEFRVAEFKPPNFKVALDLDQEFAVIDQKVTANATSNYLFGSPVDSGKVEYYVTRTKTDFTPKGWDHFKFGRQWFYPEESPELATDVLQVKGSLDVSGKSSQAIAVAKDIPYPMTYRVDAQVSDVSNLSVNDSKSFIALPSDRLIGLKANFVADAGKPFKVEVIVTDPKGQAKSGEQVKLELQQIKYSSVTQVVEGSRTPRNQVEYKTVAQAEVKSSLQAQVVTLTPPESGSYRIRATFGDHKEISATDLQIWATGNNSVNWGDRYRNHRLELKLDQQNYKIGETATALIQSPYPEAELHFAVVRDHAIYQTITKVKGGAPQIQFKITPEMLPNAAIEAVLIRQGKPLSQTEPGSVEDLVRIGFAPFKTNLDQKYLKVQINPLQSSLMPGAEQTISLQVQTPEGKPTSGQFTVMVVNEAVLQLTGYRIPDLVKTVYAEQSISTRFADNRPDVVLEPLASPLAKGWGYGGGLSAGAANTRTRTNFQAIAYYNGSVISDEQGKAQVKFKLPDDLTTWRVMVVATDGNLQFGNSDRTFITTKPLISNPLLPQFARVGDRFMAGVSITNTTNQTGNLVINGDFSGGVQFEDKNNLSSPTQSGTNAYRLPVVVKNSEKSQLRFSTKLNNAEDAFSVPLEIRNLEITEQTIESGVTENQVKIPVKVDDQVVPNIGGLEISLASTLIPQITAPAKQIFIEDQLPFLETSTSQLAIATHLQTLYQTFGKPPTDFNLQEQANKAIAQLQKLQQPDGGFAAYPGQKNSDPFVTPYAAQTIAAAAIWSNSPAYSQIRTGVVSYLKKAIVNPIPDQFMASEVSKSQVRLDILIALADLGDRRNDFLADIYAQRTQFDRITQIKLARYLSQFPDWQPESKTLFDQIQETIYETGRNSIVNLPASWSWLNSQTTAQAQALRLFISRKASPDVIDKLLQSLLTQRRNGIWSSTYDNAEALTALVAYSQIQPTPPNFTATVQLGNKSLNPPKFEGYAKPSAEIKIPMAGLPRGSNDLSLRKSGTGQLHYLVAYRYRPIGNLSGRLNGLRIVREIRPANQPKVLQQYGIQPPSQPLKLAGGQVFDIGLEIISDRPVDHVIITDPIPAGFEAVDAAFQTSTPFFQTQRDNWEIGYQTIYRDRIVAYANHLNSGIYSFHYLVRSVTPGTFIYPGAEAHLEYAPEEFGRSASSQLVVF